MQGNLSGRQKNIVYPDNDNRAYDGPVGQRNTARNYQPIIVAAKRNDGRGYFCVRTKTTNHLTIVAKHSMALVGGAGSVLAACMNDIRIRARMVAIVHLLAELGLPTTLRKRFFPIVRDALDLKTAVIDMSFRNVQLTVNNPFVNGGTAEFSVTISNDVLTKFQDELS